MEDQVTQNRRIEQAEYRAWSEFSEKEKAAALAALGKHIVKTHPWWGQVEAAKVLVLRDLRRQRESGVRLPDSPISWGELTRGELADRLLQVAEWSTSDDGMRAPWLRDACLDMAEDLGRGRGMAREGRGR
jgi:hypothetical protein